MKKLLALLAVFTLLLTASGCSDVSGDASLPLKTTPTLTTRVPNNSITIGNFKFDRDNCISAETIEDQAFLITLDRTGIYATLVASNISTLNEKEASILLKSMHDSTIDENSYRSEETPTTIPFAGFSLTHEYYMTIDDSNRITYHIDCTFTDSWFAYSFCLIVPSSVKDFENAGYLYGQFLSSGSYIGKPSRFNFSQIDYTESVPPTTSPSVTEPPTTNPPVTQPPATEAQISTGMKNALSSAKSYLSFMPFSYGGLIDQLEYEGYTTAEATYAADNCGADWNAQALESAKNYLDISAFSYSGLIDQLKYEQYTPAQATYAADNCGADWYEQAAKSAANYLSIMSFSRSSLISQLEYEGFTHDQAVYGVEKNGL